MNQRINHSALETMVSFWKKSASAAIPCLFLVLIATGCTSTEFTTRERLVDEMLPPPSQILVHNFVAAPNDVPKDSFLANQMAEKAPDMTDDKIAIGRRLGDSIATQLVHQIRGMGIHAEKASLGAKPKVNDIVLRGYFVSIVEGHGLKRIVVGFGYGSSELGIVIEGYQMTDKGLRKLGSAKLETTGSKTPGGGMGAIGFAFSSNPLGLIIGLTVKTYGEISGSSKVDGIAKSSAKAIADKLKVKFEKQGWIK